MALPTVFCASVMKQQGEVWTGDQVPTFILIQRTFPLQNGHQVRTKTGQEEDEIGIVKDWVVLNTEMLGQDLKGRL